jgi:hypothetical protein
MELPRLLATIQRGFPKEEADEERVERDREKKRVGIRSPSLPIGERR